MTQFIPQILPLQKNDHSQPFDRLRVNGEETAKFTHSTQPMSKKSINLPIGSNLC